MIAFPLRKCLDTFYSRSPQQANATEKWYRFVRGRNLTGGSAGARTLLLLAKEYPHKRKTPRKVPGAFGKSRPFMGTACYGFVGVGEVAAGFVAAGAGCVAAGFAAAGFPGVGTPPLTGYDWS